MALPRRSGRRRYTLLVLVLAAVTLLTLDVRGFGPLASAQSGVRNVLSPLRTGVSAVFDPVTNAWRGAFNYDDLEAENAELRSQLDALEGAAITDANARAELDALNAQLGIGYLAEVETVVARVVGSEIGNFSEFSVEIDRGSSNGLAVGMPVVTDAGVVGKLVRVDRDRSLMQLISDPEFALGVRLVSSSKIGLGHGNGSDARTLIVDQGIAADVEVAVGEAAVTGGRASLFPPGIPVGLVTGVTLEPGAEQQTVLVSLTADVSNLDFVSIVLYDASAPTDEIGEEVPLPTLPTIPVAVETTVVDAADASADTSAGSTVEPAPSTEAAG